MHCERYNYDIHEYYKQLSQWENYEVYDDENENERERMRILYIDTKTKLMLNLRDFNEQYAQLLPEDGGAEMVEATIDPNLSDNVNFEENVKSIVRKMDISSKY